MPSTAGNYLHPKVAERKGHHVSIFAPMVKMNGEPYLCDPLALPCGKCVGCRMDRAKQWKIRVTHECQDHEESHFITLTYDDDHLPVNEFGEPYIERRDVQLFMKNLRHRCPDHDARVFGCMEYGELYHRPHAHAILWCKVPDLIPYSFGKWVSPMLTRAWRDFSGDGKPRGNVIVERCEPNTIAYVAGYVEKKQADPFYGSYPVKPFLWMSTKPAIGSSYVSRLDGSDRHVYGNFGACHSAGIPKAYLKKCEKEPWFKSFKEESKLIAKSMAAVNQAVYSSTDEEIIGQVMEDAFIEQLNDKRNVTL